MATRNARRFRAPRRSARWMSMNDDADLRSRLETLDPRARDVLRRVLIREPGRPRRDRPTFLERRRSHGPG